MVSAIGDREREWRWGWLLLIAAGLAVYPALLWNSGAVAYDAAHVHIYRGLVFSQAISDGVLYPRWVQYFHFGLGSPVFTFYSPLPYYALDLLSRLGLAHPLGWRVLIAAGLLAACAGGYLLVLEISGRRWPAVLAGVAYLYAPYTLRNALERGSNEAFCAFLYPWVLWALIRLARRPSSGRFACAALLWAAAIGTHVLGPVMLAPVAGLLALVLAWRHRTVTPILALVAGILLTAGVWGPILQERAYVHADRGWGTADVQPWANPLPLDRLLAPPAVYDTQRETNDTGDRVGLVQTLLLALGAPTAVYAWRRGRREQALYLGGATLLGLALLWSFTSQADFAWRLGARYLDYLQFRTRLMGLQALAAAAATSLVVAALPGRRQAAAAATLSLLLVLAAAPSLYINLRHSYAPIGDHVTPAEVRDAEFRLEDSALTAFGETVPRWRDTALDGDIVEALGPRFDPQDAPLAEPAPGLSMAAARVRSASWALAVTADAPVTATLHLLYYPRWQAEVDGRPVPLSPQTGTGYAQLQVPAGSHQVDLHYATTPVEAAGLAVGVLTLLGLALLVVVPGMWPELRRGDPAIVAGEPQNEPAEAAPPAWVLGGLAALLAIKIAYVDPSTTWLRCVSTEAAVCDAGQTVSISFEGHIRLRGYRLETKAAVPRGGELRLELFWQADRKIEQGQYSFIRLRSTGDGQPANPATGNSVWLETRHQGPGGFFTTGYLPGRLYADEYRVRIPREVPPGRYQVEIGWYDVATGRELRLPGEPSITPPLRRGENTLLLPIEIR